MRYYLVAMLSLLFCMMTSSNVTAADYRLLSLKGSLVKWGKPELGAPGIVTYALADRRLTFRNARNCKGLQPLGGILGSNGIPRAIFESELENAFRTWEQVANIKFRRTNDPTKAGIVIGAQIKPRGKAYTNVDTRKRPDGGDRISTIRRSLICLNPRHGWKVGFDGNLKKYDLRFTLIHEIGHAIGLNHPGPDGQIMAFRYNEKYRTPQRGDIRGAVLLYGAAHNYPAPRVSSPVLSPATPKNISTNDSGTEPLLSLGSPAAAGDRD